MKQIRTRQETVVLLTLVCVFVLAAGGCTWSKDLTSCRQQNQLLAQQITELQYQLAQADRAAVTQTAPAPTLSDNATYLVVAGDSLWSIATKQLGSGKRYKEILALNPQLSERTPLTIGTTLKLPPK